MAPVRMQLNVGEAALYVSQQHACGHLLIELQEALVKFVDKLHPLLCCGA